jgi:hypothetical protein
MTFILASGRRNLASSCHPAGLWRAATGLSISLRKRALERRRLASGNPLARALGSRNLWVGSSAIRRFQLNDTGEAFDLFGHQRGTVVKAAVMS